MSRTKASGTYKGQRGMRKSHEDMVKKLYEQETLSVCK